MDTHTQDTNQVLYIVVPCYNEEEVLPETVSRLSSVLRQLIENHSIAKDSAILLVDDGSKDGTWTLIEQYFHPNSFVRGLKLTHNAGHQNALFAGLMHAKDHADIAISIDADLQDDVNVIPEMVKKYYEGCDIVYGVRKKRTTDTFFKRFTAQGFYRFMKMMGADIIYNHADYRLTSKSVLEQLSLYEERNLFLRGIIPMIGFQSTKVYYDRSERLAGESKYPLKKMLSFAFDGITSLSVIPIRYITGIGVVMFFISVIAGLYSLIRDMMGHTVIGWTSLMTSIWLIGGIQLICLGIIGEYVGKIYKEAKHRPKYHLETILEKQSKFNENRNECNRLRG